jgi:hypothetical protein
MENNLLEFVLLGIVWLVFFSYGILSLLKPKTAFIIASKLSWRPMQKYNVGRWSPVFQRIMGGVFVVISIGFIVLLLIK